MSTKKPRYVAVAFDARKDHGYVAELQADGTYITIANCTSTKAAKDMADALNDRFDMMDLARREGQ